MKIILMTLLFFCSLSFAEKVDMTPEDDVKIYDTWWGKSFHQKGSSLKVGSMFTVLDSYQESKHYARKAETIYWPSIILTGGGVLMMMIPPTSKLLGNNFGAGMFMGGVGMTVAGLGLFKLSNIYLTRAVKGYKESNGTASHFKLDLDATLEGARVVGHYQF